MQKNNRIVFLYTELAAYITNCMERLAQSGVEVHVFAYPVNPEAPFEFSQEGKCQFYNRQDFDSISLAQKITSLDPKAIMCSGWVDADYVSICKNKGPKITTVLLMDNFGNRSLKSKLSAQRARLRFKPHFDLAWVPGLPQRVYAMRIGFKPEDIFLGFYTADFEKLKDIPWILENEKFPKRFVFVGRYLAFKGIQELWNAYIALNQTEWQLICAGQGEMFESKTEAPGILHLGFVQPADLNKFVAEGGVFVLPSHKEPWGVVVHEFASAGFPMICTDKVGAASAFLKEGENGYLIPSKNEEELILAMKKMTTLSDSQLFKFGEKSKALASKINVEQWVNTAKEILGRYE